VDELFFASMVGNPEVNRRCLERYSRSRVTVCWAGTRAGALSSVPLFPLATCFLRFAPDRLRLTKPNAFPHNRYASVWEW